MKLLFSRHRFDENRKSGHCTEYLADHALNKEVSCQIGLLGRTLRLPADAKHVVLVGQGTGIAPLMSILERITTGSNDQAIKVAMIMGVRDNSTHMIYKSELEEMFTGQETARPGGFQLTVACSRDIVESSCHSSGNISYRRGYV